jgi:hypothetical protein
MADGFAIGFGSSIGHGIVSSMIGKSHDSGGDASSGGLF